MDLDNKPSAVLQAGIFEDLQRKIDEDSAIKDVSPHKHGGITPTS
jgi:hypothetical protein